MQRRHPALVERVRIRTGLDEIRDHLTLCRRIPVLRAGTPVGGVVERFSSPAVTSANIGASRNQRLGDFSLMRGRSDMQRRVTAVHVMTDCGKEVRLGILAARPDTNRTAREITR